MPRLVFLQMFLLFVTTSVSAQINMAYDPSPVHPHGLPNPEGPTQLLDWADLIGDCQCQSVRRNPDGTWADTTLMHWRWKYILNGMGVQDETFDANGQYNGSIRQYMVDSARWYVHYYSATGPTSALPAWEGNKQANGDIVLYKPQTAPNGMEGFYKITFSDIAPTGFQWRGEWVNTDESIVYPTWTIACEKRTSNTEDDRAVFLPKIAAFSKEAVAGNAEALANMYTQDGKLFPPNRSLVDGHEGIQQYWQPKGGYAITYHKITPVEIKFFGSYAYDYGYYEGSSTNPNGKSSDWNGKYVIIWKKEQGEWKIYLDIWNAN